MAETPSSKLSIYGITLCFTALAIFLQILPMQSAEYFHTTLGLTSSKFVALSSTYFIAYSIMQVPGGIFFDKFGLKLVLPVSLGFVLLGTGLYWLASSSQMLVISRLISGLGCSVAYISSVYVAAKYFPPRQLPLLIALTEASSTVGSLIGVQPLEKMLTSLVWNNSGFVLLGFCCLLFLITIVVVRKLSSRSISQRVSMSLALRNALLLFKNYRLNLILIYSFCAWFVIMSFAGYWLKEYLMMVHRYSAAHAEHLVELYWTSFSISSLLIGCITKSFKAARANLLMLGIIGLLCYGVMSIPVVFNYSQTMAVVMVGGLAASGVIISFSLIPHVVDSKSSGTAIALNNTFIVLGGYCGQLLFGEVLIHFNINHFIHIIPDPTMMLPNYYSALLIYLVANLIGFVSAALFFITTRNDSQA